MSIDLQLPNDVLQGDFDDLDSIDLGGRERRGFDLTHIDFVRNSDLPESQVGPWKSIDSFSRKVLIVRYYQGLRSENGTISWEEEPKVQSFFQRYSDDERDWRASIHFGDLLGSPSSVPPEDRVLLKKLLKEDRIEKGLYVASLTIQS